MKLGGYKMREVIIRARLMMASVRYVNIGIDANGFNVVNVTNANNSYLN